MVVDFLVDVFKDPLTQQILAVLASGLAGSVFAILVTSHYQKKNLEFNTITRIFDMLDDEKHREARKCVVNAYKQFVTKDNLDLSIFTAIEDKVETVRSTYDQIGILIYKSVYADSLGEPTPRRFPKSKGYLPQKMFFEAYAGSVINMWTCLELFIKFQRGRKYSAKRFMLFFQYMVKDAKKHHKGKGESEVQKLAKDNKTKLVKWLTMIKKDEVDSEGKEKPFLQIISKNGILLFCVKIENISIVELKNHRQFVHKVQILELQSTATEVVFNDRQEKEIILN
ncbi:hypothetical protein [Nitrosopumilus sp. S4]